MSPVRFFFGGGPPPPPPPAPPQYSLRVRRKTLLTLRCAIGLRGTGPRRPTGETGGCEKKNERQRRVDGARYAAGTLRYGSARVLELQVVPWRGDHSGADTRHLLVLGGGAG